MRFVPPDANGATKVKAVIEQDQRLPFGTFVERVLSYQEVYLMGEESSDGRRTLASDFLDSPNRFPIEAHHKVLFSAVQCLGHALPSKWAPESAGLRPAAADSGAKVSKLCAKCPAQRLDQATDILRERHVRRRTNIVRLVTFCRLRGAVTFWIDSLRRKHGLC